MAIQFARTAYVSRSTGGNACRKAACEKRSILTCERTGEVFNFSRHTDNVHHEILLPPGVHESFKVSSVLWNAVENREQRSNSQVAKELVLALPHNPEVTVDHRIAVARSFVQLHFVDKGVAAQVDIHAPHEGEKNWHAHVLVTTRRFTENGQGFGAKARDLNQQIRKGYVAEGWDIGASWAAHQNYFFEAWGLAIRVDATGIVPQDHMGPVRFRRSDSALQSHADMLKNANESAALDPCQILKKLREKQSVFSEKDVDWFLKKHGNAPHHESLRAHILAAALPLFEAKALALTGFFTTPEVRSEEERLRCFVAKVERRDSHHVSSQTLEALLKARPTMTDEQRAALLHVTQNTRGLALIEGRAGTGKSFTISAIQEAYNASQTPLFSMAPTNVVAQDMGDGAMTIHSFLFRVKNDRLNVPKGSVFLVDEAAMMGRRWLSS